MQLEIWKQIKDYEGRYEISNHGRVRSLIANGIYNNEEYHYLKFSFDRNGYVKINLAKNNKLKPFYVHRLVALHFVPNPDPENCREINHKDGNKQNNYFENLEWCTRSYNMKHAFDTGLKVNKKGSESPLSKAFYQFDLKGNLIAKWNCASECARVLNNLNPQLGNTETIRNDISSCLNGRFKTCCGFIFSYESSVDAKKHEPKRRNRPIVGIHKKDKTEIEFDGVRFAEGFVTKDNQILCATNISKCLLGKRESHGGYFWKYKL